MARIVVASSMVRVPLGGRNQAVLAWLVGLRQLGHDAYFVERTPWSDSNFDVPKRVMNDHRSYGSQSSHPSCSVTAWVNGGAMLTRIAVTMVWIKTASRKFSKQLTVSWTSSGTNGRLKPLSPSFACSSMASPACHR